MVNQSIHTTFLKILRYSDLSQNIQQANLSKYVGIVQLHDAHDEASVFLTVILMCLRGRIEKSCLLKGIIVDRAACLHIRGYAT